MQQILRSLSFMSFYLYIIIPLAPFVYIFIRWRSYRDGDPPDSQLGMKAVLYYFKTLAYHVLLAGTAVVLYGGLTNSSGTIKSGLGLLLSGGILYAVHFILIGRFTNTRDFPLTARAYNAFNVIIIGLVSMIAFVVTVNTLFERGFFGIELPLGFFIVYTIALFFQLDLYLNTSVVKRVFASIRGDNK